MAHTTTPLAAELNDILGKTNPIVLNLLSNRGKSIYFPKAGILGQTAEAKGKKIDATIGIALSDDRAPLRLQSIADLIKLQPEAIFPYAPSYGKAELRKKWQELIEAKNPSLKSVVSLPVITNALTHALSVCAYLFVNAGDEIIIPDKFWGNYKLTFENGFDGKLSTFNTFKSGGFDIGSFKSKLSEKTGKKIILLNFPNNPSGYTPTLEEYKKIIEVIGQRAIAGDNILVILDDAYFGLVYEKNISKESLFAKLADIDERVLAVKIDGVSKEEYAWGLRVGFVTFGVKNGTRALYEALEAKAAGTIRGQISNVSLLSQSLILSGLNSKNYHSEKQKNLDLLKTRYIAVKQALKNPKYTDFFSPLPFNSGYFMCIELKNGLDSEPVRHKLLEKYDTGVISLPKGLLRIAFSSVPESSIPELFENIFLACQDVKKA